MAIYETIDPDMTNHETPDHETTDHETTDHDMPAHQPADGEMTDYAMTAVEELVVLCAADGSAVGTEPKATVHHRDTPLHLAFSCYVFDPAGRVLLTRRAYGKRTFPGVRTNSVCGHPAPAESMPEAVLRRLRQELGIVPSTLDLILPSFRYRATAADGTVENELCPVYRALITTDVPLAIQRTEVDDVWWVPWAEFAGRVSRVDEDAADPLSVWCAQQVQQLRVLGSNPLSWPAADPALLPAAAIP
jgi:isopentenyl-diphosphate delta-isomerase